MSKEEREDLLDYRMGHKGIEVPPEPDEKKALRVKVMIFSAIGLMCGVTIFTFCLHPF